MARLELGLRLNIHNLNEKVPLTHNYTVTMVLLGNYTVTKEP